MLVDARQCRGTSFTGQRIEICPRCQTGPDAKTVNRGTCGQQPVNLKFVEVVTGKDLRLSQSRFVEDLPNCFAQC